MDNDVLIVSYDKGYGNEIPVLLIGRNTDKGMEIIKAMVILLVLLQVMDIIPLYLIPMKKLVLHITSY